LADYYIPVGEVVKSEPKSIALETPRKKRPKELAVIHECCTGCSGSPACVPYCLWLTACTGSPRGPPPFRRIEVDRSSASAARSVPAGSDGSFLDGLPVDAIEIYPRKKSSLILASSSRSNPGTHSVSSLSPTVAGWRRR